MGCGGSVHAHPSVVVSPPPEGEEIPRDASVQAEAADTVSRLQQVQHHRTLDKGLPETPMGKQAEEFKFSCPICFHYFKTIWKTGCCGNLICEGCAVGHINSTDPWCCRLARVFYELLLFVDKLKLEGEQKLWEVPNEKVEGCPCPVCNVENVQLVEALDGENRSYVDSPYTKAALTAALRNTMRGEQEGFSCSWPFLRFLASPAVFVRSNQNRGRDSRFFGY